MDDFLIGRTLPWVRENGAVHRQCCHRNISSSSQIQQESCASRKRSAHLCQNNRCSESQRYISPEYWPTEGGKDDDHGD